MIAKFERRDPNPGIPFEEKRITVDLDDVFTLAVWALFLLMIVGLL